ncbi:AsmA-like C-terminal region-containing protein [Flavivirga jejuensis]|uniref:AsmA-like C-terminal region-containing protein n=1 Tax=Flavivirga jejuensis TaxID=870487 RepID=A0ABT8WN45_9FLAO|nr:AsmA-like C-terminal region-containing protein [Flavivirga jejuensis]MDO5974585.1 AsmA-like C-terminal region-containing protein [Flavivirga jejuensis]
MKKALKISGISLLIILALLIATPFAFKSQIKDMVKRSINENLNAQVEFSDVSLSFIKSFPKAHVSVSDLVITNLEPFKGQTFVTSKNIALTMSIMELFKTSGEDPIVVKSIAVDEILLTLKTDKFGNANYDIAKSTEDAPTETETESGSFSFDIENYSINNSALAYIDDVSKMTVYISELNHQGKGIFSAESLELDTKSEANISFIMDSSNYLSNNPIKLDAIIGLDLANSKYTFKENKGLINKLPLEFQGYVQLLENGQEIDVTFENPETSFKNFLALIPEEFSKDIEGVETTGDFKVKGMIKGISSEETIPNLDISIISNNASFKYPDLPKRVENIVINTSIKNTTGNIDDTYVDIKALNFKIDEDVFKSSISLKNITQNMLVNASIDGVLNLANITKVYPVELESTLTGILKGSINTVFDMKAIETNAYERIKNNGSVSISDFVFSSEDMTSPIHISDANMTFNPEVISLNSFKARTGNSDLNATGTIKNLLGFLLSDNTLQGYFDLNSTFFKIDDFVSEEGTGTATETITSESNDTTQDTESLKIPSFLDCTINANAKTVVYDNLNLKDVKGTLIIKDQRAILKEITSSIFDGTLAVSGDVSTKNETPTFNVNLGIDGFDISKSFKDLELLRNLAPIAQLLQGELNSNLSLTGNLDNELLPDLNSLSGGALAELLATKINTDQGELFNKLEGSLGFIDFDKLNLKDLKTNLEFANGEVSVKPFQVNYEDITIDVSGSHGFDTNLKYNAIFNVPAKYLGSDVNQLIGKIDTKEAKNISIPVTADIEGTYTKPLVKTDLKSGVKNLTNQLIEIEKQKLLNTGKSKVTDLISGVIGGNKTKTDSIKKEQNNSVKDVLGGIIGGEKDQTDSAEKTDAKKEAVKNVLGGLLSKKKKTTK